MSDEPSSIDAPKIIGNQPATETAGDIEQRRAIKDYSRVKTDGRVSMNVKVSSPFRTYYDGPAFSVSAENATGPFDILPRHHNFISLLKPCNLVVRTVKKGDQKIHISGGVMHVKADRVIVFLDV
jgi:hypothetical protein